MLIPYKNLSPQIAADVFIAPNATIIGNVVIEEGASVWFGAVVRGDSGRIVIGAGTNVQDNAVIHVNEREETLIGRNVTIGHGALMEGCRIGDGALIGMGAIVLSGATVGEGAVIAAGAVVREGETIPPNTLAAGVPAKARGEMSAAVRARMQSAADRYRAKAAEYRQALGKEGLSGY